MTEEFYSQQLAIATCKNCGEKIEKKYCTHCGQKVAPKRIDIKALVHDIPHAIFHVDSGFFYNVKQLFLRPGFAIKDYLEGRRKAFFHPVTYLAILMVFNLFAVKITNLHYYDEQELAYMTAKEIEFIKEYDATQWWFLEHNYLYMLIAIPVSTTFYYFFFRLHKHRYNFAENAIITMFIIAQGVLIQSTLYLLTGWIRNGVFIRSMEILNLVMMTIYAAYAMYQVVNPVRRKWFAMASIVAGAIIVLLLMLASSYFLLWLSAIFH